MSTVAKNLLNRGLKDVQSSTLPLRLTMFLKIMQDVIFGY